MKIFVKARPKAKENLVKKIDETHFEISVTEPPIQGKANTAIIDAIAEYFNIPRSQVHLVSGFSSKEKTFEI